MLVEFNERLREKHIDITFGEDIEKYVIQKGFNDEYGARPLKRFIQRSIETFVALKIIEGNVLPNIHYRLVVDHDDLVLQEKKGS